MSVSSTRTNRKNTFNAEDAKSAEPDVISLHVLRELRVKLEPFPKSTYRGEMGIIQQRILGQKQRKMRIRHPVFFRYPE